MCISLDNAQEVADTVSCFKLLDTSCVISHGAAFFFYFLFNNQWGRRYRAQIICTEGLDKAMEQQSSAVRIYISHAL